MPPKKRKLLIPGQARLTFGGQPTVSTCDDRVSDSGVREDANSGSTGAEDDAAVKSADTAPRNFQEI